MGVLTRTGGLSASSVFTWTVPAQSGTDPRYRMLQVTNENGGGAINVAWSKGDGTVADPPVSTASDGSDRDNFVVVAAVAGASQTFKVSQAQVVVKIVSSGSPRFILSVFDDLM